MITQRVQRSRFLPLLAAVALLSVFSSSEVRDAEARTPDAPRSAMVLVAIEEGQCQGCEQWEERVWCTFWFCWQERHKFTGHECGGGNGLATREGVQVVLASQEDGETRNHSSYCAACGNSSTCHTTADGGPCHERGTCSGGGGIEMKNEVQRVRDYVRTASAAGIAEILTNAKYAFYNEDRQAVQFRSPCDPTAIADQVNLSEDVALLVERAISAN